jgi:poly(U)-specific endoribonuclease
MKDIYQQIWDADQDYAGLKAVRKGTAIDAKTKAHGYIIVDEDKNARPPEHRLISDVVIPDTKAEVYKLAKVLFNKYTLDQTKPERNFPEEEKEVQAFLNKIYDSPPMQLARDYVSTQSGKKVNKDQWWAILQRVWFEQFDEGNNKDLSGFEHVVVGEQKQGKVQGYHCWYKYYLDERFRRDDTNDQVVDCIRFIKWKGLPEDVSPEVVTLSFEWRAFDYDTEQYRKLTKPIGGFWIGPSIVGLMAMGTVRFLPEAIAPRKAVINGVNYNLPLFRSQNSRNLRTFYPEFTGMA